MKPISIETYIASNNPSEAASLLREMGAPQAKSFDDLVNKLHIASKRFGEKAFVRFASIDTPYRDLVIANHEVQSNCSGCDAKSSIIPEPVIQVKEVEVKAPSIISTNNEKGETYFKLHPIATGAVVTGFAILGVIGLIKLVK